MSAFLQAQVFIRIIFSLLGIYQNLSKITCCWVKKDPQHQSSTKSPQKKKAILHACGKTEKPDKVKTKGIHSL